MIRHRRSRALTLLEIVIALVVLMVLVLGFASMSSVSINATRSAKPTMLAQEACQRLIEQIRTLPIPQATDRYWDNPSVVKTTINGVDYATSGGNLDNVLNGVDGIDGLLRYYAGSGVAASGDPFAGDDKGVMGMPLDGFPPLRLRFLTEEEYAEMWGITDVEDANLNFSDPPSIEGPSTGDEVVTGGAFWPATGAYRMFPILIEIHWAEGTTARKVQLKTILCRRYVA